MESDKIEDALLWARGICEAVIAGHSSEAEATYALGRINEAIELQQAKDPHHV